MTLNEKVQNSILHEIERWSGILKEEKDLKPVSVRKENWNFKNESDWRWGHFVGMIEGLAILYHHVNHRRQILPQELHEIEEFVQINTREIRDYFYK